MRVPLRFALFAFVTAFALVTAHTLAQQVTTAPGNLLPTFSIGDVSATEGNAGTKTFTFNVTLANPSMAESRVSFATADGTATVVAAVPDRTLTQDRAINIPNSGRAAHYSSSLVVSGLPTGILRVKARLNGLSHTFPADLDIVLVGPGGQTVMLMSDAGAGLDVSGVNLTFDDGAPALTADQIVTGTYAPTDLQPGETLPVDAPSGPYGTALSTFSGTNPNGTWELFIADDGHGHLGNVAGGFSLIFTTVAASSDYLPTAGQLIFPPGTTTKPVNVTVNGDTTSEATETFTVNLSGAIFGEIGDGQGVGTIVNDDNFPPTISAITAKSTPVSTPIAVSFTVGDAESGPGGVTVTASSTNTMLVPDQNLVLSGSGAARTVTITPATNLSGFSIITVRVSDGVATVPQAFALRVGRPVRTGDFDLDGRVEIAVFRPSTGVWYVRGLSTTTWGAGGDRPVAGDYDGDDRTDIAVYRPSTGAWFILRSSTGTGSATAWGGNADIPVPGDYDGDGKTDIGVFRPSTGNWFLLLSSTSAGSVTTWGGVGDIPVARDFDADGKTDIAVFRPSTGAWYILNSSTGTGTMAMWGGGADIPVAADYDADGRAEIAVFRPSTGVWYILNSSTATGSATTLGGGADIPVPGDYDGDLKADIAVFRPSTGNWSLLNSSTGTVTAVTWGGGADIPILRRP